MATITTTKRFEAIDELTYHLGDSLMIDSLAKAIPADTLAYLLTEIAKDYDLLDELDICSSEDDPDETECYA